jgi:hypothetical protein
MTKQNHVCLIVSKTLRHEGKCIVGVLSEASVRALFSPTKVPQLSSHKLSRDARTKAYQSSYKLPDTIAIF